MKKQYKTIFASALLFFVGSIISQKAIAQSLSLNLSGINNQIVVPTYTMDLTPGNAVTIQYDIKFNSLNDFALINATNGNIAFPLDCYYLNGSQTITLGRGDGVASYTANAPFTPTTGQWYNFAVVVKQDTTAFYIDGALLFYVPTTNPSYNAIFSSSLRIGMRSDDFGDADAQFDNVRVWTVEKSPEEIDSLRSVCIDGSAPNLSILYTFDDNAIGGFITDLALNDGAQDGNIVGGISFDVGTLGSTHGALLHPLICSNGTYTAPSGAIYTTAGFYTDTIANASGCDSLIPISLAVNQPIAQKIVNQNSYTFCESGVVNPTIVASDFGVNYTLLDNAYNIVQGPIAGTGGAINFNPITAAQSTSYHVSAEKQYNDSAFYANNSTYGQTNNTMPLTQNFTFEGWVKGNAPNPAWIGIVATSASSGTGAIAQFAFETTGILNASIDDGPGAVYGISGNTVVADGKWHFITLTNDQNYLRIYVDGNLDATYIQPFPVSFSMDRKINIGTLAQEGQGMINLNIDNLAIWSETRTQAEIMEDMNRTFLTGSETNLNAFYNFNINNMPLTFNDATGNYYANTNNFPTIVEGVREGLSYCSLLMTDTIAVTVNTVDVTTTNNSSSITANATGATYQWIDCNNTNSPISGATNAIFTATANGNYAVIVTQNGCTDTSACVTVGNLGIQSHASNNFSVYPNPSTGNITIALDKGYNRVNIQVVDMLGKVIATKTVSNEQTIQLNLGAAKGVYFVKCNTSEGQQSNTKLVIE
jgi:hypothetical protein